MKDFGKPTVSYEKFLALDADFHEIIISGPIQTNYLNMMIYKGKDLPILNYPDVTAESTATINEGMTYDEVVNIYVTPSPYRSYSWENIY